METKMEETKILEGEEAQKAVDEAAQNRAEDPFQIAAMVHSAYYNPFLEGLDKMTGKACKRILQYLVSYPFFMKEPRVTSEEEKGLAYLADRLCEAKFLMIMSEMNKQTEEALLNATLNNQGENNG
jgi:hypothetical protein